MKNCWAEAKDKSFCCNFVFLSLTENLLPPLNLGLYITLKKFYLAVQDMNTNNLRQIINILQIFPIVNLNIKMHNTIYELTSCCSFFFIAFFLNNSFLAHEPNSFMNNMWWWRKLPFGYYTEYQSKQLVKLDATRWIKKQTNFFVKLNYNNCNIWSITVAIDLFVVALVILNNRI